MDAVAAARNTPVISLRRSCIQQSRIPDEWNRYRPTVHQIDTECVIRESHTGNPLICGRRENAHSKPPKAATDALQPTIVPFSIQPFRSPCSGQARVDSARILLTGHHGPRGRGATRLARDYRNRSGMAHCAGPSAHVSQLRLVHGRLAAGRGSPARACICSRRSGTAPRGRL